MNSRNKGKRGELEFANKMTAYGWSCRRSQQFCGAAGDADLQCELPLHIEVKRVQRLNIQDAVDQAVRESDWRMPTVAHRKNHCAWNLTFPADLFLEVIAPNVDWDQVERYLRLTHRK